MGVLFLGCIHSPLTPPIEGWGSKRHGLQAFCHDA
jgi:hypothetical protein